MGRRRVAGGLIGGRPALPPAGPGRQVRRSPLAWFILIVAGLFEVAWAVCLKSAKGFTRFWPSAGFAVAMFVSVSLLGVALKSLPLGTAYAVWTGVGAVGTVLLGIILLGEPADATRLACIGLILAGIVGLKLASPD